MHAIVLVVAEHKQQKPYTYIAVLTRDSHASTVMTTAVNTLQKL